MSLCGCGCGKEIIIKSHHKRFGIPKYLNGHYWRGRHRNSIPCSEEKKINISNGLKGKPKSDKHKQKLRKPKSGATKQKMSENHADVSGENNPMFGIPPKHGKGIFYVSPLQGRVWLRSTYEFAYARYLDSINELWYYEIKTFNLGNMTYTPDFFLPRIDKFIEIKGYMHENSQKRINKYLEQYPQDLEILYKKDLIKLGCKL